jgi:hypothetical protein
MPGPKEQDPDQVQNFMRVLVLELLRLWEEGIIVTTPTCPLGCRVRIALVGVICDKPAAHKLGGFGSHSHRLFCTKCWIDKKSLATSGAFEADGIINRSPTYVSSS